MDTINTTIRVTGKMEYAGHQLRVRRQKPPEYVMFVRPFGLKIRVAVSDAYWDSSNNIDELLLANVQNILKDLGYGEFDNLKCVGLFTAGRSIRVNHLNGEMEIEKTNKKFPDNIPYFKEDGIISDVRIFLNWDKALKGEFEFSLAEYPDVAREAAAAAEAAVRQEKRQQELERHQQQQEAFQQALETEYDGLKSLEGKKITIHAGYSPDGMLVTDRRSREFSPREATIIEVNPTEFWSFVECEGQRVKLLTSSLPR